MEGLPVEITDRDLMLDHDPNAPVRRPIGFEQRDAGKPDDGNVPTEKAYHTLVDMAEDFEFFTTGVIHAASLFDRDPVVEFNRMHQDVTDPALLPKALDYAEPFFEGLGVCLAGGTPVNFNNRIYMIVRDRWEQCRDCIAGMAMVHHKKRFYGRINFYEFQMVDPFAVKRSGVIDSLPEVTITTFGVSTNRNFSYLQPRTYPSLPILVHEEPKEDILIEGQSVIGPPLSPEVLLPRKRNEG